MSQPPRDQGRWRNLPLAPPAHGSFLAWYAGCHCDQCEESGQSFLRDLARRAAQRLEPAPQAGARLSADDRAHLEPAVRSRACPFCGALRYHRCRDPHFPLHFTDTHPERRMTWGPGPGTGQAPEAPVPGP